MSALNLMQRRSQVKREVSRRIGYTNGLHDIFRFSRVVTYLHEISPATVTSLRSAIVSHEPVRGKKYAEGVIEVARALGLVHRSGTSLTLSDIGYALYAVHKIDDSSESTKALLLRSVLVYDGEATLNLLDIISGGALSVSHGELLVRRLLRIIENRKRWAEQCIEGKFARDMILQELRDCKRRLSMAVDLDRKRTQSWAGYNIKRGLTPEQRLQRFYAHTVNPRRGWLRDLGCIEQQGRHSFHVTNAGQQVLASFRDLYCDVDSVFVLPFSLQVSEMLGVDYSKKLSDLFWRATAASFGGPGEPIELVSSQVLPKIEEIYPHARFHVFNEAAIDSIFHAFAAQLASEGHYMERRMFDDVLKTCLLNYPDRLYRLRQRHGGSGYITIKEQAN